VLFAGDGPDEGLGTVGAGGRPVVSTRERERERERESESARGVVNRRRKGRG